MQNRLLVIEDDSEINQLITMNLADDKHAVDSCEDGERGLSLALTGNYDLIILDLMLPMLDGLEICRQMRNNEVTTPIIMLTAKSSEADRVVGLEMGADDYLTKPFSVRELQARVKAQLRRNQLLKQKPQQTEQLCFGDLSIDEGKRQVSLNQKSIELTSTEFDLLVYLARRPGVVFSRTQLLDAVWGYSHSGYEHTVNSHINRLRNKLEKDPAKPYYVLTVWGVGYKFADV